MRRKDILEGPLKNFQQSIAKGYQATQKGGGLAPDSFAQGIKKFFTQVDEPNKDKDKDKKAAKGGAGTADSTKTKPQKQTSNAPLDIKKPIPKLATFTDGRIKYEYNSKIAQWIGSNGKRLSSQDGVKAYNKVDKSKREYVIENGLKDKTMSKAIKEGLADLADMAERDHEVQMARADLYKIAKYAIKLHDMMKNVSEAEGLEGWQQAKITKAADYIGSVYHNLEYDLKFADGGEMPADALAGISESKKDTHCSDKCCGAEVKREDCKCPPECEHCNCNDPKVDEGKSPHKKGTKKYKKHMAAMHAEGVQDMYKLKIAEQLNKKLGK